VANFRKGKKAAEAATQGSGGAFTPTFRWKNPGDEYYLQFLTSDEDILTIQYHPFIMVGETEDGDPMYRDFISPLDPAFEGEGLDYDPLTERFDVRPKSYNVALAVELKPVKEGKKIVDFEVVYREFEDKDGNKQTVPNVRLVMMSVFQDLFPWLFNFADVKGPIEESVFHVKQAGKGKDKTHNAIEVGEAIELDFDPLEVFNYEEHLEKLASPARYAKYIDPLPDDAVVVQEWGDKKGKGKSKPKKSSTKSTRVTKTKDAEEEAPVATRSTRFARLAAKAATDDE
jgi:hypothetical protein